MTSCRRYDEIDAEADEILNFDSMKSKFTASSQNWPVVGLAKHKTTKHVSFTSDSSTGLAWSDRLGSIEAIPSFIWQLRLTRFKNTEKLNNTQETAGLGILGQTLNSLFMSILRHEIFLAVKKDPDGTLEQVVELQHTPKFKSDFSFVWSPKLRDPVTHEPIPYLLSSAEYRSTAWCGRMFHSLFDSLIGVSVLRSIGPHWALGTEIGYESKGQAANLAAGVRYQNEMSNKMKRVFTAHTNVLGHVNTTYTTSFSPSFSSATSLSYSIADNEANVAIGCAYAPQDKPFAIKAKIASGTPDDSSRTSPFAQEGIAFQASYEFQKAMVSFRMKTPLVPELAKARWGISLDFDS